MEQGASSFSSLTDPFLSISFQIKDTSSLVNRFYALSGRVMMQSTKAFNTSKTLLVFDVDRLVVSHFERGVVV